MEFYEFEDDEEEYDGWQSTAEEEVDAIIGTFDEADCPCCFEHGTLRRVNDHMFKCSKCGFVTDERTLAESFVGLTRFIFDYD